MSLFVIAFLDYTALNAPINRGKFIDHFKYFVLVVVRKLPAAREMRCGSGNRRPTRSDKSAQIKRRMGFIVTGAIYVS